jgi:hypothetical protein
MLEHFTSGISEVNFISHVGLLQCCRRVARSGQFFLAWLEEVRIGPPIHGVGILKFLGTLRGDELSWIGD